MLGLIIDGLIVVLVLTLLVFGMALRRRLAGLRRPDGELHELIAALDAATGRAERVLADFRREALESGTAARKAQGQLTALADDLRLLTDRADREADRLAALISDARTAGSGSARATCAPERDQAALERALRSLR